MAANAGYEKIIKRSGRNNTSEDAYRTSKRERTVERASQRKGKSFGKYSREA